MGGEKYSLEKIIIDGKIYNLVVSTDGDRVSVTYNGKIMSVVDALEEIGLAIMSLKNSGGSTGYVEAAADEEINEMLDEVFGPRE